MDTVVLEVVDDEYVNVSYPHSVQDAETSQGGSISPVLTDVHKKYLSFTSSFIEDISPLMREISLKIHDNPELNFKEFIAHKTLTTFMKTRKGWEVTPSAYGIETAFVAVFDTKKEGSTISYNAEYDALKGIGHACGHNLIAIVSTAAALAAAAAMTKFGLGGKVVLFGTPAEEGGGGKIKLLDAGAYSDHKVDINLISHPGNTEDAALVRTNAYKSFKVEYFGKEAHAAASPWMGINALDALITAYNAISVLRQQTMPGDIIQGYITDGGVRPNIIHAYAAGIFVVRATTKNRVEVLQEKVNKCFKAGAEATGAKLKITQLMGYDDLVPNKVLGRLCRRAFNDLGGNILPPELDIIKNVTQASSDQGNVSYAMPSISLGFKIESEEGNHNPKFTEAARTKAAHVAALKAAKALAVTGLEILTDQKLLDEAKKEFDELLKQEGDSCGVQNLLYT